MKSTVWTRRGKALPIIITALLIFSAFLLEYSTRNTHSKTIETATQLLIPPQPQGASNPGRPVAALPGDPTPDLTHQQSGPSPAAEKILPSTYRIREFDYESASYGRSESDIRTVSEDNTPQITKSDSERVIPYRPAPVVERDSEISGRRTPIGWASRGGASFWNREQAMSATAQAADQAKAAAWARAQAEGWDPIGMYADESGGFELMAIHEDELYVYETANREAAISVAANAALDIAPVQGSAQSVTVGIWDQGGVRVTHQEFTGRATIKDNARVVTHATHAGGTIAAAGVQAAARGMAPDVRLDSYDWNNDLSEMISRAMREPGEPGTMQISSHSYGFIAGWANTTSPPRWYGTWGERKAAYFGMYDWYAAQWDDLCYNAPYYLPFKSAGNNRSDAAPAPGASFQYYDGGWKTAAYHPDQHPLGDGEEDGGYDSIPLIGNAKNVITVGAIGNAAHNGERALDHAEMTRYSGWGPADDGRVKPDIVAKGSFVYSSRAGHDADYSNMSGTSMATPSAAGSAALLVAAYANLFPGDAILASTLKGLILHTADDLGTPGPDYVYGWGLMNTEAAMQHLLQHADDPEAGGMIVATAEPDEVHAYRFAWDGQSPVRVTLSWTDPAGRPVYELDHRVPRLVNDLDLRIVDAEGNAYLPYVLDPTQPDAPATTGVNTVDNTEQVHVQPAGEEGVFFVEVVAPTTLENGHQVYSLIVSGLTAAGNPEPPVVQLDASVEVVEDAAGHVRISGTVSDGDSSAVAIEVQFMNDDVGEWKPAWLAAAESDNTALTIDNTASRQIVELPLTGLTPFSFTWDSLGGEHPVLESGEARLRVRAWDGETWSHWGESEPFLPRNQGPDADQATYNVSTWAFERYLVRTSVTVSFTNFVATTHPIAGYLYGVAPEAGQAAFTQEEIFQVHDLERGKETVIHLWAVDTQGALSRPVRIPVFALPLNGNWDGSSEPTPDMLEGSSVAAASTDFLVVEASANAGMPILRFPYLPGKQHRIEAIDLLDQASGWQKLEDLTYTVDRGWIVWVNDAVLQPNSPQMRFFRVVAD